MFFILLLSAVFMASGVLKKKTGYFYKDRFFSSKVPYDTLFFGSSHMHEGIDPMYLWENYGISSYNLASSGESIQMTYYVMREALDRTKPKAVFIDSFKISDKENSIDEGYAFVHESIDPLPLNKNKLEAIDYAAPFFEGGKPAFLSNLYAYHNRYTELKEEDFLPKATYDRGAYIMTEIYKAEPPDMDSYIREAGELGNGDGVRYYKKIIELCRERGVTPVLINIPANSANYSENSQKRVNALMEYTEENGGLSINFLPLLDDIGINYDTDFGDASHLNFMGAAKTADYIAEFLRLNFNVEDHRGDSAYSEEWDRESKLWREQKVERLSLKKDAVSYIFLADDPDRKIRIFMKEPEKASTMYGLTFCLERTGITPEKASDEETGGFDMMIEVRSREDDRWLASGYFNRSESGKYVKADDT